MAEGSCLCGGVVFSLQEPVSSIELCHCRKCRKSTGAPFAATLYVKPEEFRWLTGEELVTSWDAPIEESPPAYRHSFCRRCGSGLPLRWEALPFVEVPVALLDAPIAAQPRYQMFECQRLAWIGEAHRLRWYERASPFVEKVLQEIL